jgi:hypothetical protein
LSLRLRGYYRPFTLLDKGFIPVFAVTKSGVSILQILSQVHEVVPPIVFILLSQVVRVWKADATSTIERIIEPGWR